MKINQCCKTAAILLLCVSLLTGCALTRPVSGEPSYGAGRNAADHTVKNLTDVVVCLDAGHGFDDIGTSSSYLGEVTEKEITFRITLFLKEALEEQGITVILTHDGDSFPKTSEDDGNNLFNPKERTAYANTLSADYFFSVHCDSYAADSSVRGTRIYYSKGTKFSDESAEAARIICAAISETFPDEKSAVVREMTQKEAYYVIRETEMPSALIEVGFVTNPTDAACMLDDDWCKRIAEAVSVGIVRFFTD